MEKSRLLIQSGIQARLTPGRGFKLASTHLHQPSTWGTATADPQGDVPQCLH